MSGCLQPNTLDEALVGLAVAPRTVLAGGTDVYPAHVGRALTAPILDITRIAALRGITVASGAAEPGGAPIRIGATTTWSDLVAHPLPPAFDALKAAAREVGGRQIQNAATVAGNLCNASPAADGAPPLLALGAEIELASLRGTRRVALGDFIRGNRRTVIEPDELATAIIVPPWPAGAKSAFVKLGHRRYLVISIAMVAAVVACDAAGVITRCAVAVGACSAVAQRLTSLETRLIGTPAAHAPRHVEARDLGTLAPIDDVRGSAAYRREAAQELVRRALAAAASR
jgi:CO/xanthine dehydrogenase FAD-binding subunit